MTAKAKNDLRKYGISEARERSANTARVVASPGGGWAVRNGATGQFISVGTAAAASSPAKPSTRSEVLTAADHVIERHREVIKRLAKR